MKIHNTPTGTSPKTSKFLKEQNKEQLLKIEVYIFDLKEVERGLKLEFDHL